MMLLKYFFNVYIDLNSFAREVLFDRMVMWKQFIEITQNIFGNDIQVYVMFVFRMTRCNSCKSAVFLLSCIKNIFRNLLRGDLFSKIFIWLLVIWSSTKIFLQDDYWNIFFVSLTCWMLLDKCKNLALFYCSNNPEAYSEPFQTSKIELFCENSWRLLAFNYFHKKLYLRSLKEFWIQLCNWKEKQPSRDIKKSITVRIISER